jgi:hypothetical protein
MFNQIKKMSFIIQPSKIFFLLLLAFPLSYLLVKTHALISFTWSITTGKRSNAHTCTCTYPANITNEDQSLHQQVILLERCFHACQMFSNFALNVEPSIQFWKQKKCTLQTQTSVCNIVRIIFLSRPTQV